MAYTREQIEQLHNSGKMPDWVYYQSVDKPAWQAIQEQRDKFISQLEDRKRQEAEEKELEQIVSQKLQEALKKALGDLFKGF